MCWHNCLKSHFIVSHKPIIHAQRPDKTKEVTNYIAIGWVRNSCLFIIEFLKLDKHYNQMLFKAMLCQPYEALETPQAQL